MASTRSKAHAEQDGRSTLAIHLQADKQPQNRVSQSHCQTSLHRFPQNDNFEPSTPISNNSSSKTALTAAVTPVSVKAPPEAQAPHPEVIRKRPRENPDAPDSSAEERPLKQSRQTVRHREEETVDPIEYWARGGCWPRQLFE